MNSKSASATATVVAALIVVILSVAVGIAEGFYAFKETRYASFSKRSTRLTNVIEEFSGQWYVAIFDNFRFVHRKSKENYCYRETYVIDPDTGSLTITKQYYDVKDGVLDETDVETYVKLANNAKTNLAWRKPEENLTLKLQRITKDYGFYTLTHPLDDGFLIVLTKHAVITEEQLADAETILKVKGFRGDELHRDFNTHCDKLPPLL